MYSIFTNIYYVFLLNNYIETKSEIQNIISSNTKIKFRVVGANKLFMDLFSFCPLAQVNSFILFFLMWYTERNFLRCYNIVAIYSYRNEVTSARYHNHKGEKTPPDINSCLCRFFTFSLLSVHGGHARLVTGRIRRVEIIWRRSGRAGHLTHPYHLQSPISAASQ